MSVTHTVDLKALTDIRAAISSAKVATTQDLPKQLEALGEVKLSQDILQMTENGKSIFEITDHIMHCLNNKKRTDKIATALHMSGIAEAHLTPLPKDEVKQVSVKRKTDPSGSSSDQPLKKFRTEGHDSANAEKDVCDAAAFVLGVICTRDHELDALDKTARAGGWQRIGPLRRLEADEALFTVSIYKVRIDSSYLVVKAACFEEQQGPVVAAAYTSQFLARHHVNLVCMIGIAGGRALGDVCIATKAYAPLQGRVKELESDDHDEEVKFNVLSSTSDEKTRRYYYMPKNKIDSAETHDTGISSAVSSAWRTMQKLLEEKWEDGDTKFNTFFTSMLSYSQVRNDCELEFKRLENKIAPIPKQTKGEKYRFALDMEAYAFLHVLRISGKPGFVIKGISDVGKEWCEANPKDTTLQALLLADHQTNRRKDRKTAARRAVIVLMAFVTKLCSFDLPAAARSHILKQ